MCVFYFEGYPFIGSFRGTSKGPFCAGPPILTQRRSRRLSSKARERQLEEFRAQLGSRETFRGAQTFMWLWIASVPFIWTLDVGKMPKMRIPLQWSLWDWGIPGGVFAGVQFLMPSKLQPIPRFTFLRAATCLPGWTFRGSCR